MDSAGVLEDGFERVRGEVHDVLNGILVEQLHDRPDAESNPIAWLIWHLTRVQDDHIADASGSRQVWLVGDWQRAFGLPLTPSDTGYGHTPDEVASVRVDSPDLLAGYYEATHEQTLGFVRGLDADSLDRVIDERWQPPVTLGVRLVSVLAEDLQHVGQAAYLKGVLRRR